MTKLEDKLIASVKKPEQDKPKADLEQAKVAVSKSPASAKRTASKKTKQKPKSSLKKKQASVGTNQSILHPQRIWPD